MKLAALAKPASKLPLNDPAETAIDGTPSNRP